MPPARSSGASPAGLPRREDFAVAGREALLVALADLDRRWDTVRLGPPERDLWMVLDEAASEWPEYLSTAGTTTLDERALRLYRLGWDLSDIAEYVGLLRRPHERTADTEAACDHLAGYLPVQ
jgi:hypothetical protein